jgi:hypothetical protein
LRGINIIQLLLQQLVQLLLQELGLLENELLHRVEHVVYVDRDVLALERALQQVPFQHALYVNQ